MIRIQECLCILLRISAILPEAISDGGLTPITDTDLLLATYRGGSHLTSDMHNLFTIFIAIAIFNVSRETYISIACLYQKSPLVYTWIRN